MLSGGGPGGGITIQADQPQLRLGRQQQGAVAAAAEGGIEQQGRLAAGWERQCGEGGQHLVGEHREMGIGGGVHGSVLNPAPF